MTKRILIVLLAATVVLSAATAFAQANTGTVKGKAMDEHGKPLAGATIRVTTAEGQKLETKVDPNGQFELAGVPAGKIKIEALVDGQPRTGGDTTIIAGEVNEIPLDMAAAAARQKMSPEERKKLEESDAEKAKKSLAEHNKIKNLNAMLTQAKPLMDIGNYDGAIAIYEKAVQADPTKDLIWANLGLAYLAKAAKSKDAAETKEFGNKAVETFQKAISINPNNGGYHNNLGQSYARAGNTGEALKEFQMAGQIDPTSAARYYFNAGATLTNESTKLPPASPEQKKKLTDANAMFQKSVAADPKFSDGEAYYQIATNLLSQATMSNDGKMVVPDGTADAYQKYLAQAPNGRYADSAKQTLAALGSTIETTYKQRSGSKKK